MSKVVCVVAFVVVLLAGSAYVWLPRSSSYADCVLENIQGVASEQAAGVVVGACRLKFPREKKKEKKQEWDEEAFEREFFGDQMDSRGPEHESLDDGRCVGALGC